MTTEHQKQILDTIKSMTHGMPADEKLKTQEQLLAGVVVALDVTDKCPSEWKSLLLIGRAHKLFGRTYGNHKNAGE